MQELVIIVEQRVKKPGSVPLLLSSLLSLELFASSPPEFLVGIRWRARRRRPEVLPNGAEH